VIVLLAEKVLEARLVELVSHSVGDTFELEVKFLLLIAKVSVARNVDDFGSLGDHFLEAFEIDSFLANLELLVGALQDLEQPLELDLGRQSLTSCRHVLQLLQLLVEEQVDKGLTVEEHQVGVVYVD